MVLVDAAAGNAEVDGRGCCMVENVDGFAADIADEIGGASQDTADKRCSVEGHLKGLSGFVDPVLITPAGCVTRQVVTEELMKFPQQRGIGKAFNLKGVLEGEVIERRYCLPGDELSGYYCNACIYSVVHSFLPMRIW